MPKTMHDNALCMFCATFNAYNISSRRVFTNNSIFQQITVLTEKAYHKVLMMKFLTYKPRFNFGLIQKFIQLEKYLPFPISVQASSYHPNSVKIMSS